LRRKRGNKLHGSDDRYITQEFEIIKENDSLQEGFQHYEMVAHQPLSVKKDDWPVTGALVRGCVWCLRARGTVPGMTTGRGCVDASGRHNPQNAIHSSLTPAQTASETSREPDSGAVHSGRF
jgi:hypothetical protein